MNTIAVHVDRVTVNLSLESYGLLVSFFSLLYFASDLRRSWAISLDFILIIVDLV